MRIARTLSAYLIQETLIYCAFAFCTLTFLLLAQNLLRRLDELFLVGMTGADLLVILRCTLPVVITYALPFSFLIGLLLALRRMGSDGEILGVRTGGISPLTLLLPALILGGVASGLLAWLLGDVEYRSRSELVQLFKNVAARGAILEPGKFREIGQHLVFVEDRDRDGGLHGVMIYDQSQPKTPYRIFAKRGRFEFEEGTAEIRLELFDGDVHLEPKSAKPDRYERIRFDAFSYRVDVGHLLGKDFGPVRPKQMSAQQLHSVLARVRAGDSLGELDERDPAEYALEIHRRKAQPFAPLLFAALGVPIALGTERRSRNHGLFLALFAALAYYSLIALSSLAAREHWLTPAISSWLPNLTFAGLAIWLIFSLMNRIIE